MAQLTMEQENDTNKNLAMHEAMHFSATYFEKNKLNSFESMAVMFDEYRPASKTEPESMLCYAISDCGSVSKEIPRFKVVLDKNSPSGAASIKIKCTSAEAGRTAFILDRVSKDTQDNVSCGWINQVSRDYKSTILSGVAYIFEPETALEASSGKLKPIMVNKGDAIVTKTKPYVLTTFPQFKHQLNCVEGVKDSLKLMIDNNPLNTGIITGFIRIFNTKGDWKTFQFSTIQDKNQDYKSLKWDELKEIPNKANHYSKMIDSIKAFIDKSESVILEVMPAVKHYLGVWTAQNLSALSNATNYANYFLITDKITKDCNGADIPWTISGGRQSFVGIETNKHSVTKVIPTNFNTYTHEVGLDESSKIGKTLSQIKTKQREEARQAKTSKM